MSGYLEVKYPFKANLGLNPFKSWKRQWCILRPSPTRIGGGSLAVYCSEAGAAAGCIELPAGCLVRRTKSRSRPYAFAVFCSDEVRKPRILLAAASQNEAQLWMDKIKALLNGNKYLGTETLLKDSYSVNVLESELAHKCSLGDLDCLITMSSNGLTITQSGKTLGTFIPWKCVAEVTPESGVCVITINSEFPRGGGTLKLLSPLASELSGALKQALKERNMTRSRQLSRSDGDLSRSITLVDDFGELRRGTWSSRPSQVSVDDTDLRGDKDWKRVGGPLSRCVGGDLMSDLHRAALDDGISDRRSIASGIYEEIAELPDMVDGPLRADLRTDDNMRPFEEPTYESVAECVYATMRRTRKKFPPPLPPRLPFGTTKLGESWNSRLMKSGPQAESAVTRHSSLGSLPRCCSISSATSSKSDGYKTKTLPKTKPTFNVFRKRLKSDPRPSTSPKSDPKDETKKKKFDFTPTKDIFKSFKVGKKMKSLKINGGNLKKIGETKSCEFLDETEHVSSSRCSKSVECLEDDFDDDLVDLSIECDDHALSSLSLPQDIVELILRGREQLTDIRIQQKQIAEGDYMPMSPIIVQPPPIEHHYMVMSPRTNIA